MPFQECHLIHTSNHKKYVNILFPELETKLEVGIRKKIETKLGGKMVSITADDNISLPISCSGNKNLILLTEYLLKVIQLMKI